MRHLFAALLLAAACVTGYHTACTTAYMTVRKQEINELSFENAELGAVLTEPNWNAEKGICVLPGAVIPKDPQITNTSENNLDELVAVQLTFVYTDSCPDETKRGQTLSAGDMAYVADVFSIDYNTGTDGGWERFDDEEEEDPVQHFYYRDVLRRNAPGTGDTTTPVFTSLTADKTAGNARYSYIQKIGGFAIRIQGSVLQYMEGETKTGLNSARSACQAGLFCFAGETA